MAKTTLTANEFAINEGAKFSIDPAKGLTVKLSNDGTMSITFNFQLNDMAANFQMGPGTIGFLNAGVFKKQTANHFKKVNNISGLTLSSSPSDQILLSSDAVDVDVITDGEKGREGLTAQ